MTTSFSAILGRTRIVDGIERAPHWRLVQSLPSCGPCTSWVLRTKKKPTVSSGLNWVPIAFGGGGQRLSNTLQLFLRG